MSFHPFAFLKLPGVVLFHDWGAKLYFNADIAAMVFSALTLSHGRRAVS